MRSAAVFLSNSRPSGSRPTGRAGKLRTRDVGMPGRIARSRCVLHRKLPAEVRARRAYRHAAPRIRPARKTVSIGFAAMVLH
jgi:hypothetical protein